MSKIPVESSEVQEFTPDSLKNIPDAPVFRLRAATERHLRHFRNLRDDEGLEHFTDDDFNDERRLAISRLWTEEDGLPLRQRLDTIIEMAKQDVTITDADLEWFDSFNEKLFEEWPRLRVMLRKNKENAEYGARFVTSTFVMGWRNLDVPFRLDAGYLPPDDIPKLARALEKIERKAIDEKVEGVGLARGDDVVPGLAYFELYAKCSSLLRLDEDEEKNSPAPSPNSSQSEDGQTASESGKSTAESKTGSRDSTTSSSETSPTKTSKKGSKTATPSPA